MSYIRFENVEKSFLHDTILQDVNIELEKGKIYGFMGRNGAGKTIIFKMLCGLMRPSKGDIYFEDQNITHNGKFIEGLGALIETPGFIPHYSGFKNLWILNGLSKHPVSKQEVMDCLKLVGLNGQEKKHVKAYSLGMRQKLGIAQAILNHPQLLVLDEPFNGLDENSLTEFHELFKKMVKNQKVTILVASHNREDMESLCDEIYQVKDTQVKKWSAQ